MSRIRQVATASMLAALTAVVPLIVQAQPGDGTAIAAPGARVGSLQVATRGAFTVLNWFGGRSGAEQAMIAVSRDGGRSFSGPITAGAARMTPLVEKAAIALAEAGPGSVPALFVAWPTAQDGRDGVVVARSADGARSFSHQFLRSPALPPQATLAGLALTSGGRVHVVWLAGNRLLYSSSEGTALKAPRLLDSAASRCRVAVVAAGPGAAVSIFWHRSFGGGDDEFAFIASDDNGQVFRPVVRVSSERWGFRSCPGASPSLTVDAGGALRFVFQATVPGTPPRSTFFVDRTTDRQVFRPRAFLDAPGLADARRPVLSPDGEGGLSLVWEGMRNDRRYVMIRHSRGAPGVTSGIEADWMRPSPPIVLDSSGNGTMPSVARATEGMLAVWLTGAARETRIATRRLTINELCGETP